MARSNRPIFLLLLLVLSMRAVMGSPCCMPPMQVGEDGADHSEHHHHHAHQHHANHTEPAGHESHSGDEDHGGHEGHEGPSANPCCSGCGSSLPPEPALIVGAAPPLALPEPTPVRALATPPPFPAYDARGPPLLI